jgi:hypothetical protein
VRIELTPLSLQLKCTTFVLQDHYKKEAKPDEDPPLKIMDRVAIYCRLQIPAPGV